MATAGVYQVTCRVDGGRYVGSAVDVDQRVEQHKTQLRAGKHPNRLLQEAWVRHGEDQFVFKILEQADPWKLEELEKKYLKEVAPEFNLSGSTSRQPAKEPKVTTTCRLPASTLDRLKMSVFLRLGNSQSDIIDEALRDFFEKHKIYTRFQLHVTDENYILMRCDEGQPPRVLEVTVRNGEPPEKTAYAYRVKLQEPVDVVFPGLSEKKLHSVS
jgi:group I intron endonuclease